jgi:hypothetical protein
MSDQQPTSIITWGGKGEKERRRAFLEHLRQCPIPDDEFFLNAGLFLTPATLSRVLFMDFLYRQILPVQGIIIEFGCRWGQSLSLFTSLRGMYEPFNRLRRVVGFDTFAGLPAVTAKDGDLSAGMYSVTANYADYLRRLLAFQEGESPLEHIVKHEVIEGDASVEIQKFLERNPQTVVALAYFDLDIYQPTRDCLLAIRKHLTRGSVLGFDELNELACPGETVALGEVFGLARYPIRRFAPCARTSYLVVDDDCTTGHP